MIILDRREYDEIAKEVPKYGLESRITELAIGDCQFSGNGEDGWCTVGCERKKLGDLVQSMKYRRLSGDQLMKLREAYDYIFLFVEGLWRPNFSGDIETSSNNGKFWYTYRHGGRNGKTVNYRQLVNYLTTLELKLSTRSNEAQKIIVRRTYDMSHTAAQYVALWHWFNDKTWAEHTSHEQLFAPAPIMKKDGGGHKAGYINQEELFRRKYGEEGLVCWKMLAQLKGIDTVKARRLTEHFLTIQHAANASEKEWQKVEGVGPVLAGNAIKMIRGVVKV